MTDKRFSELPDAQALTDADILALTQGTGEARTSRRATLGQLASYLSPQVTVVKSGESLDAAAAAPGTYVFDVGSVITKAPNKATVESMANAVLEVYETGSKARLSFFGRLNTTNVSRTAIVAAQFLLMPPPPGTYDCKWKWLGGVGDGARPMADGSFTIAAIEDAGASLRDILLPEPSWLPVLLAGKLSNALTPEEDAQLTALTQQMLAEMRGQTAPTLPQEDA